MDQSFAHKKLKMGGKSFDNCKLCLTGNSWLTCLTCAYARFNLSAIIFNEPYVVACFFCSYPSCRRFHIEYRSDQIIAYNWVQISFSKQILLVKLDLNPLSKTVIEPIIIRFVRVVSPFIRSLSNHLRISSFTPEMSIH